MIAYRLLKPQSEPEFQEVPEPHAGPGQVVLKVAGCGLCHTDVSIATWDRARWADTPPPFTFGHEIAGWVQELGSGVTGFKQGDPVAVLPVWHSCGRCHACRSGQENFCFYITHLMGAGVGFDGGLAPYVLIPETRYLVPIGGLDPVEAAPLTDAGLTTYTAIKPALPLLYPGSTAVVVGVGGLGLLG